MKVHGQAYFARDTLTVAHDLVGSRLIREQATGDPLVGRIVETEAYTQEDPAFHGSHLYDPATDTFEGEGRGADLFTAPGRGYVYLIYGMYWLLNVVTEPDGTGGAVLIRAVEPEENISVMRDRRSAARRDVDLTNGPGKLTEAFGVDDSFHQADLTDSPLYFAEGTLSDGEVVTTSSRIGISKGVDRAWRFFIEDHPYVSPATPSGQKDA